MTRRNSIGFTGRRAGIIGGGLGGLSAAVHLRRAGFDADLFEANDCVGGRAGRLEQDGFRFDTGPSLLNYPWVFEELFRSCGRRLEDYVTLLPVDPSIRFLWPDGTRLALSSTLPVLRAEFERLEPGSGAGLMAFLADAEAKYRLSFDRLVCRNARSIWSWMGGLTPAQMLRTSVWRSLNSELARFFRNPRIREALGSYGMYLGGSPWHLPGLFSILPYGELAYGLSLPKGGMYALVEGIRRLAEEQGVRIHTGRRVRRIATEGGRARGLEFEDGSTFACDVVVSNVDVPASYTGLLGRPAPRVRMTPGVVTFYWGVRGDAEGLPHHSIFLPDDVRESFRDLLERRRVPPGLPFYVSAASITDPGLAPPGHTTLFGLVPVPALGDLGPVDWAAEVARLRAQVLGRLRDEGFAMDEGRIVFERVWTPVDWRDRFGLHDGSAFGAAHTMFQLGPFRLPNADPALRGLYYVGASTTPGTGLPLVTLGGRMTAERVLSDAR